MTDRRWCKNCDKETLILRTNRGGTATFYGCENFPSCRYTEKYFAPDDWPDPEAITAEQAQAERERLDEENLQLAKAKIRGREELEAMCLKRSIPGPYEEGVAMRSAIPGFGRLYEELEESDRPARADYWGQRTAAIGGKLFQELPYDKTKPQA